MKHLVWCEKSSYSRAYYVGACSSRWEGQWDRKDTNRKLDLVCSTMRIRKSVFNSRSPSLVWHLLWEQEERRFESYTRDQFRPYHLAA